MQNSDNFLLVGQYSCDDVKFWTTASASSSSSSSSSQGFSEFSQQNLSKLPSPKRTKNCRLRNVAKKSPNAMAIRPKRKKSSENERQRNLQIKGKLRELTKLLPGVKTEIPRIRTLRLANRYIEHLLNILDGRPEGDFERIVNEEMQTSNSYKERAETELSRSNGAEVQSPMSPTASFHHHPGIAP